jgi:hypothetical protein
MGLFQPNKEPQVEEPALITIWHRSYYAVMNWNNTIKQKTRTIQKLRIQQRLNIHTIKVTLFTKNFTTLIDTSFPFNFTLFHFSFLPFGFNHFKFSTTSLHFTSPHFTSLHFTSPHFTSLLYDFRHTSITFTSPRIKHKKYFFPGVLQRDLFLVL